jgi:hypothetical protein
VQATVPNAGASAIPSRNAGADHRCLSMILKTSCANQSRVPRNADTLRLKRFSAEVLEDGRGGRAACRGPDHRAHRPEIGP